MPIKQLWAPWRMEFIKGEKPGECVFCAALTQKEDRKNLVLHRADKAFIILNKYPYNNGHLMIVPNRHIADFAQLEDEELLAIAQLSRSAVKALTEAYKPEGFNLGMNLGQSAGAGIKDHLHLHVLPRWGGDTNFLPVIAETKSMHQHLEGSYDQLKPWMEKA